MIVDKIAEVKMVSNNGGAFYQLNQKYLLAQNNFDVLNMEVAAITFALAPGQTVWPLVGSGFYLTIVDKNNIIKLDSYPVCELWNGRNIGSSVDFREYPIRRFKLHDIDLQKCFFKFSNVAGGPIISGEVGTFNFYLVNRNNDNSEAQWLQST